MEKFDQRVKRITVAVSNLGVRIIHKDKGFYHNFMSENGGRIISGKIECTDHKNDSRRFLLDTQHERDSVKKKPASSLVVNFDKKSIELERHHLSALENWGRTVNPLQWLSHIKDWQTKH